MTDRRLIAALSVALVALLAATWLLSGFLVTQAQPSAVAAGRALTSFAGLSLVAALQPGNRRPAMNVLRRRPRAIGALGALGVFGYSALSVAAIRMIGAATTNVVLALLPCMTFLVGIAAFHRPCQPRALLGTVVAVAGAIGFSLVDNGRSLGTHGTISQSADVAGITLALGATLCMALYALLYGSLAAGEPSLVTLPAVFGVGAALLCGLALVRGDGLDLSGPLWGDLLLLGGVVYVPAYIVQHELFLRRGALFTTTVSLVVPFAVRTGAWALGSSAPPAPAAIGLLLLCCTGARAVISVTDQAQTGTQGASRFGNRAAPSNLRSRALGSVDVGASD